MHVFTQRISRLNQPQYSPGQRRDYGNFEGQPEIPDHSGKIAAFPQQQIRPMHQRPQASQQRRRRPRRTQFLDPRAGVPQCVERQIDTIKGRIIGMTILDVVV